MRVAIANQKGGVGKTTTAVNLAAALGTLGHRILLVDLDPQANATTGVGVDHRSVESSVYDVLIEGKPAEHVIRGTDHPNLDLLPSSIDLAGAELELVPALARETKLRAALEPLAASYDAIFIDCPPSLGLLTVNALTAATCMLVPIQCEYYALEGVSQLLRNIDLVRGGLNPGLAIGGILLTMYDARTKLSEEVANEVRAHFGEKVFATVVPRSVRLSEAPSYGQPAVSYDPSARGSMSYRWLAEEFAARFFGSTGPQEDSPDPARSDLTDPGPPDALPETPPSAREEPLEATVESGGPDPGLRSVSPEPQPASAPMSHQAAPEHAPMADPYGRPEADGEASGASAGEGEHLPPRGEAGHDPGPGRLSPAWAFSVARNILGSPRREPQDRGQEGGSVDEEQDHREGER